jgi:hypothetical protein
MLAIRSAQTAAGCCCMPKVKIHMSEVQSLILEAKKLYLPKEEVTETLCAACTNENVNGWHRHDITVEGV